MAGVPAGPDTFFRVGPAEPSKAQCFAVKRGIVHGTRFDADVYHPEYFSLSRRINELSNTAVISEIVSHPLVSGFAAGKDSRAQFGEDSVPQIRPTQILPDGEIELFDAYGIPIGDISDRDYVQDGEVLFNNTNSTALVGKSAVFREAVPAVCSNHVTRLRLRNGIEPEFVAAVLNMLQERRYFARLCTNFNNQAGVNTEVLANVRIPLPPSSERIKLVADMETARVERRAKLAEADALLAGLDDFLLDALGIRLPREDDRRAFAVRRLVAQQRFDPHFHSPKFAQIQEMLSNTQCVSLGSITGFSKEVWRPQNHEQLEFRYIEIGAVDPKTGRANWSEVPTDEAPSRAKMAIRADDIIVSLTRPHHGSIAHLGPEFDGCVASTGFAVIRDVAKHVRRDYLWCALRAKFCLSQMLQRTSGGNYPAITESQLANIFVPIPDTSVQETLATEFRVRHDKARRLHAEAESGWLEAKRWFEEQLLWPGAS